MMKFLKKHRRFSLLMVDILCIACGYIVAMLLAYHKVLIANLMLVEIPVFGLITIIGYLLALKLFKTNSVLWTHADVKSFVRLAFVCAVGAVFTYAIEQGVYLAFEINVNPTLRMNVLSYITIVNVLVMSRNFMKLLYERKERKTPRGELPKLLMIGAGSAAEIAIKEFQSRGTYEVVGLIDDDREKQGCEIGGVRVLGKREDIVKICKTEKVNEILVAMPGVGQNTLADIVEICEATGIKTRIIPQDGMVAGVAGEPITSRARDIQIEDMLYREPVELENDKIGNYISGSTVMVTGGGGSIGSEICRQVVKFKPNKLVILDNYENNAYELMLEIKNNYPKADISVEIATVRDKLAVDEVFAKIKPDIVFHAAAHKHVPLMENTPKEAIKNNIFGTFNVAKSSIKYGVKRFIMISTDKAVNPTNIMGATKRVCEMMVQTFNDKERTEFVAVRFGNVLGSNGSVIPIFKQQIKNGGPVKVTHKEITRFFMTIPEAASLVLQAGVYAQNGEVFVLDMGKPIKIYELAEKMIKLMGYTPGKDMEIEIIGLRPGEKLYEELYMTSENMISTRHKRIYIAKPVNIDKEQFYAQLLDLQERIEDMSDIEVKQAVADITGTYTFKK